MSTSIEIHSCPCEMLEQNWLGLDWPFERIQREKIYHFMHGFSKYVEAKTIENKTGSAVDTFVYDLICRYSVKDITITDQGNLYLNCNVHLHLISKFSNVFHFKEYIYPFCTHTVCIMSGNVKMYIIHLNC